MHQLYPIVRRVRKPLLPPEPERQKAGQSGLTSAATPSQVTPVPLGQMEVAFAKATKPKGKDSGKSAA